MDDPVLISDHLERSHHWPLGPGTDSELHHMSHATDRGIARPHRHPDSQPPAKPNPPRWLYLALLAIVAFLVGRDVGINAGRAQAEDEIWEVVQQNWIPIPRADEGAFDHDLGSR